MGKFPIVRLLGLFGCFLTILLFCEIGWYFEVLILALALLIGKLWYYLALVSFLDRSGNTSYLVFLWCSSFGLGQWLSQMLVFLRG